MLIDLEEDPVLLSTLQGFVRTSWNKVGVYLNLSDPFTIAKKWQQAVLEPVGLTNGGKYQVGVYRDIDLGLMSNLSKKRTSFLLSAGKLSESTPVHMRYLHGNIHAFLLLEDLDERVLMTDKTSVMLDIMSSKLHHAVIGDYTSPNLMYERRQLDGIETTVSRLLKHPEFRSFSVIDAEALTLTDLPQ